MRVPRFRFDIFLRHPPVARGIAEYRAGGWSEITDTDSATYYEIGRLIAAEMEAGRVKMGKDFVEIDGFVLDESGGYHAKFGNAQVFTDTPRGTAY